MLCAPLEAPDNGDIQCTGSLFEDTCSFTCDDGFELSGSPTRTCQSDANWSGTEAVCVQGIFIKQVSRFILIFAILKTFLHSPRSQACYTCVC